MNKDVSSSDDDESQHLEWVKAMKDYLTPGHPTYLAGSTQLKRHYPSWKLKDIERFLSNIDAYTLHREAKRPRSYNPIYVRGRDLLWQADLADVSRLASHNNNVKYLLTVLDTFSRRAWALPLKNKTSADVWKQFRRILGKRRPRRLLTDRGKEFVGSDFQRGLKRFKIQPVYLHSEQKAAHIERFNRTLKRLIFSFITQSGGRRYLEYLPQLLKTYNTRYHRMIRMAPMQAHQPKARMQVLANMGPVYWRPRKEPTLQPNDLVRVQRWRGKFHRGHDEAFSRRVYRVASVNTIKPLPTYTLTELDGPPIEGTFYREELQQVRFNDIFKVKQVLRRANGRALVSWRGWGPAYNTWIDENDLSLVGERLKN